jgi:hypothetical protein
MRYKSEAENEEGHEERAGRARNNEIRVRSRSRTLALALSLSLPRSLAPSLAVSPMRECTCARVHVCAHVCVGEE